MSLTIGLLMILTGLAIMAFGLFMFYAWLPLLYALVGFDVGILLARTFTGMLARPRLSSELPPRSFSASPLMFLSPIDASCSASPAASCSAFP